MEIGIDTPAGEDFSICVSLFHFDQDLEQIYADFDVDEHVAMWLTAGNSGVAGVPSARELVEDAEWIDTALGFLVSAFRSI